MRCEALALQVDGCRSYLRALVLTHASSCLFALYTLLHRDHSKAYSNPHSSSNSSSYNTWLDAKLAELVVQKQLALDIFVALQSRVPLSESYYANPHNPAERVYMSSGTMRTIADTVHCIAAADRRSIWRTQGQCRRAAGR